MFQKPNMLMWVKPEYNGKGTETYSRYLVDGEYDLKSRRVR